MMPKSWVTAILVMGVGVVAGSASGAKPPELVSPLGMSGDRCPTFSWSAVSGASGYELVVYGVSEAGEVGTEPLLSVRLPGGAAAWTPPATSCLAAGSRYAWTLRALGDRARDGWSEAALFEVSAAPSLGEVEAAIATLRRYLADSRRGGAGSGEMAAAEPQEADRPGDARGRARMPGSGARARVGGPGVLRPETEEDLESVAAASVPTLGNPSLTVDANVALGAASNLFKDGSVFLWDDTTGNTALGRLALSSATGTANGNTAVGHEALRYTTQGIYPVHGSRNTAVGDRALRSNTTGSHNTASGDSALLLNTTGYFNTASGTQALQANTTGIFNTASGVRVLLSNTSGSNNTASGYVALFNNTSGSNNTASGYQALYNNTTGSRNTALGNRAGDAATTGSDNIFLGSGASGVAAEGNTIRIGGTTGAGTGQQNRTFIAGIRGITTANADAINVLIDTAGQLGTASSSREVKQDIREIGELSRRLLELRPVAFRYRQHVATDPETPLQFGLLAEEVAEVFPELVVVDGEGRPETVKYHLLTSLLLNELQRTEWELASERQINAAQQEAMESQAAQLSALRDRLGMLERAGLGQQRTVPWWRRRGSAAEQQRAIEEQRREDEATVAALARRVEELEAQVKAR